MRLYDFTAWLLLILMFVGLDALRFEPEPMTFGAVAADTVTYGDKRIVYKVATDTSRNASNDLRRLPDLSNAPTGARFRIIWDTSASFDSVLLVTGDTFAMSPLDSSTAVTVASNWGYGDPYEVTLAWHNPPPSPLQNFAAVAEHDTLRSTWDAITDSVRLFSGLDGGGDEDTVYVAGNATPHDRIVPTIPGDYYSCSNAYTDQATGDYSDNRCDNVTVDTAAPGGGSDYPNEPAGYSVVARQGWSNATVSDPATASDFDSPESGDNPWEAGLAQTEIVNDGTSPAGSGKVMRGTFPNGLDDGVSPWRWDLWSEAPATSSYSEIYVSLWLKIEGTDYQNQSNGTKIFYISYGSGSRQNENYLKLKNGTGSQTVQSEMDVVNNITQMNEDGSDPGGSVEFPSNGAAKFTVGSWHQIEFIVRINDIGPTQDNGTQEIWIDGTKIHDRSSLRYRSDENPDAIDYLQFTPVYGGNSGDVRTRDDHWRIAELYISGVN